MREKNAKENAALTRQFLQENTVTGGFIVMRCYRLLFGVFFSSIFTMPTLASPLTPNWSKTAQIDSGGRSNPYGWDKNTLKLKINAGIQHALQYPLTLTGFLMPAQQTLKVLNAKPGDALFDLLKGALLLTSPKDFRGFQGFWSWLGLHPYPENLNYPYPMGVSFVQRGNIQGMTLGCATCHSGTLFGKSVLGMSNRFSRANLLFLHAKNIASLVSPETFGLLSGANSEEKAMYADSREKLASVGVARPQALGLDTSLAQVALSLSRRAETPWAEASAIDASHPRPNLLDHQVADSKPAVWWNLKYKTRWLSDGSVVSGNPILTNFLWNEIGRGADLKQIDAWITRNSDTVEELTTAVFATKAPKWKEYLPQLEIHVDLAKRGEVLFAQNCAHCHGNYEKNWKVNSADTVQVLYHAQTPVVDVGTDLSRARGMKALEVGLNPLAFSENRGIKIEAQEGYVPPPLEGIFARYPYLHNNSIPNLCALMTKPSERPVTYTSGEAIDPLNDFDSQCVGYPTGNKTPTKWLSAPDARDHLFDTRKAGLSNAGHYEGIFTLPNGSERYTPVQKLELIEFLKTL